MTTHRPGRGRAVLTVPRMRLIASLRVAALSAEDARGPRR